MGDRSSRFPLHGKSRCLTDSDRSLRTRHRFVESSASRGFSYPMSRERRTRGLQIPIRCPGCWLQWSATEPRISDLTIAQAARADRSPPSSHSSADQLRSPGATEDSVNPVADLSQLLSFVHTPRMIVWPGRCARRALWGPMTRHACESISRTEGPPSRLHIL
jgi:hypothetical protein